ncbi:hypothetical protein D9758_012584 [Tetrapyrgos nigripes]|uniref:beta-glucosidase n=1 Tax=Tetrapyrgos nigripes TaxID=182062 RepID=A0A8H5CHT1_9AGAR|nr:hypothetical protein D9758_012584 [Tetrapyrgos nigripes]
MLLLSLGLHSLIWAALGQTTASSSSIRASTGLSSVSAGSTAASTSFSDSASISATSALSLTTSPTAVGSGSAVFSSVAASSSVSLSASASAPVSSGVQNASTLPPGPPQAPIPGVFPATDPLNPPSVDEITVVPDFAPAWAAAYEKARAKIADWDVEQLVSTTTGVAALGITARCVGNIASVNGSNGWPGLCLQDGPLGVRLADRVTAFPPGFNTVATFNRSLIRTRGLFMGSEFKAKGTNIALGPMMNMLRVPQAGRNFEGFGADPFLAGETAYETVLGMQQGGIQVCAKHYVNNEQETARTTSSSIVDDRTQHEIYTHPFLRSVMAGAASIMCSYNQINGTYACENDKSLSDILKGEFGFQGFVVSDWGATHSTLAVVKGLDMDMPGNGGLRGTSSFFGSTLEDYVNNGTIPLSRLQDMATRIVAAWYFLHQDSPDYPPTNFDGNHQSNEATNEHIDVQENHKTVVREIGQASTVLLKNVNGALPLKKPRTIFLAGSDARPGIVGPNGATRGQDDGILGMGGGSGAATFPYLISPYEAIQRHAIEDHTTISWVFDDSDLNDVRSMAAGQTVAVVFVNAFSGEGSDRTNLTLFHGGENLIQAVASVNRNTMVVVNSVGPLIIDSWIEHPNITGVLWAGVSGQEAGNAIADVLYGDFNPSGRLAFTIAKQQADYPAGVVPAVPGGIAQVPYNEGLGIDYRAFDARNIAPRFEFGFGLSYTKFSYSNLRISRASGSDGDQSDLAANWEAGQANPRTVGSSTAFWLHRPAFEVKFDVQNTGDLAGGEIPQLYLHMPSSAGEPPSILRGFTDVVLNAGEKKTVTIHLSRHSLSFWDTGAQGWRRPNGDIGVSIGASSRDFRLTGTIQV